MILSFCAGTHSQPDDLPLHDVLLVFLDSACSDHLLFIFLIGLKEFADEVLRIYSLNCDLQVQVENDVDEQVLVYQQDSIIQNLHDALINCTN
jgi:hypothetical protein